MRLSRAGTDSACMSDGRHLPPRPVWTKFPAAAHGMTDERTTMTGPWLMGVLDTLDDPADATAWLWR